MRLPRGWDEQFACLVAVLYLQVLLFFFAVHLTSPVFDAPASERYALHNQVGLAAGELQAAGPGGAGEGLNALRWHLQSLSDWSSSWFPGGGGGDGSGGSSTHPSYPPLLPASDAAPLLHADSRLQQSRNAHLHSASPYMFKYLEHVARAYQSREQLQTHMMQHTIRQGVWERVANAQDNADTDTKAQTKAGTEQEPSSAATTAAVVAVATSDSKANEKPKVAEKPAPTTSTPPPPPPPPPQPVEPVVVVAGDSSAVVGSDFNDSPRARAVVSSWNSRGSSAGCKAAVGSTMMQRWEDTRFMYCEPPSPPPPPTTPPNAASRLAGIATVPAPTTAVKASTVGDSSELVAFLARFRGAAAAADAAEGVVAAVDDSLVAESASASLPSGFLECRSTVLEFLPAPTAPHSYCGGANLFLDLGGLGQLLSAPRHRPGYAMGHLNHYAYPSGTFAAACTTNAQAAAALSSTISADHQRDIIGAFTGISANANANEQKQSKQLHAWREHLRLLASRQFDRVDFLAQLLRLPTDHFELPPSEGPGSGVLPSPASASAPPPLIVVPHTLLMVTRENGEHCNFFHALTDFFNAFLMVRTFGLDRPQVQVLMMDNHGPSPFDDAWGRVFSGPPLPKPKRRGAFAPSSTAAVSEQEQSPPHPVLKLHQLLKVGFGDRGRTVGGGEGMILASSVVVSPPGYSSPFYRHLFEDDPKCGGGVSGGGGEGEVGAGEAGADLVKDFAAHFLSGYADNPLVGHKRWTHLRATLESMTGISPEQETAAIRRTIIPALLASSSVAAAAAGSSSAPLLPSEGVLHLVLVSRRPYDNFVEHKKIARQILNEDEGLLDFLTAAQAQGRYSDVRMDVVDLARLDLQQQLALITSTDILIGMHGAALSHTLFLPPWSALVELHPLLNRWLCFKHQTEWMGHLYFPWRNLDSRAEKEVATGSGVVVDPASFQTVLDQAIAAVRNNRRNMQRHVQDKK